MRQQKEFPMRSKGAPLKQWYEANKGVWGSPQQQVFTDSWSKAWAVASVSILLTYLPECFMEWWQRSWCGMGLLGRRIVILLCFQEIRCRTWLFLLVMAASERMVWYQILDEGMFRASSYVNEGEINVVCVGGSLCRLKRMRSWKLTNVKGVPCSDCRHFCDINWGWTQMKKN